MQSKEKAERAGAILHLHMSERMKVFVKEEMNPVEMLKNLEERINLKIGSKMVIAMHKLGRISLAESINITDYFARIEEQVTILNSDPNEKMVSERMHILLLQSSLTEEYTVARGFISQNPKLSVEQVQSLLVEHAHHLQESQGNGTLLSAPQPPTQQVRQ